MGPNVIHIFRLAVSIQISLKVSWYNQYRARIQDQNIYQ